VHDVERLLAYVRSPPIFQHLLSYIRSWAQHVGLYGQIYGYLSGYSWAILCAYICHSSLSPLISLSSIEHFSIDQFFSLVQKFFSTYAQFNWSAQSLRLYPKSYKQISHSEKSSVHNRGSMRIISPSPPFNNTGRSTINSTRDLIIQGFQRVTQLLDTVNTITTEYKLNALKQILELNNEFPSEKIQSILQLTLSGETSDELDEWIGWMKSRLAHFLNDCENECRLVIQTQSSMEYRSNNVEVCYSIGFQVDEQALNQHRNFHYCLNKFLDQFKLCPNRTDTMKISHKLISIHDWKLERMQPKAQRTRK
jgi:poly(A) polymerase